MGCVGRSSDGLVFTSALISPLPSPPPRNNPDPSSSIFFSLSLCWAHVFFLSRFARLWEHWKRSSISVSASLFAPMPNVGSHSISGGLPSRKRKKRKKKPEGGGRGGKGTSSYPSPSRTRCTLAPPSSRLRL